MERNEGAVEFLESVGKISPKSHALAFRVQFFSASHL